MLEKVLQRLRHETTVEIQEPTVSSWHEHGNEQHTCDAALLVQCACETH
jgi:hypothetical protein